MIPNVTDTLKTYGYRFLISLYRERCTLWKRGTLRRKMHITEKDENKADLKVSGGQCFQVIIFYYDQKLCNYAIFSFFDNIKMIGPAVIKI